MEKERRGWVIWGFFGYQGGFQAKKYQKYCEKIKTNHNVWTTNCSALCSVLQYIQKRKKNKVTQARQCKENKVIQVNKARKRPNWRELLFGKN